jgi:hypothetical protein
MAKTLRVRARQAASAKTKRKTAPRQVDDDLPTTWMSLDRETGTFKELRIVDMTNSHLCAAIAYCERKAATYGELSRLPPKETAAALWPGYVALVKEAQRRFSTLSAESARSIAAQWPDRAIVLPDDDVV